VAGSRPHLKVAVGQHVLPRASVGGCGDCVGVTWNRVTGALTAPGSKPHGTTPYDTMSGAEPKAPCRNASSSMATGRALWAGTATTVSSAGPVATEATAASGCSARVANTASSWGRPAGGPARMTARVAPLLVGDP